VIKKIRILLWKIIADLEQRLYPYESQDNQDYYYTIKNDETGEEYMIIEWIKSFDERIIKLQEDMVYVKNQLNRIKTND
jgi:hypothetical protein